MFPGTRNSFKLHLNRIYILREGLDPKKQHTLTVRISEKRHELSQGNNRRIVYFGLNGDPRTPKGVDVDGIYFDGSKGYGIRAGEIVDRSQALPSLCAEPLPNPESNQIQQGVVTVEISFRDGEINLSFNYSEKVMSR